jgi:hypothetical protein
MPPTTANVNDATIPNGVTSSANDKPLSAAQELVRYTKIVRRLKWKLPYLASGYRRATAADLTTEESAEAELMFKLDFYEYYMLLERALVHLLGVFAVRISSGFPDGRQDNGNVDSNGNKGGTWLANHRYHHNVLAALDAQDNPLHVVLGTGGVRTSLARAKDLRNRWKYADEEKERGRKLPLESYDLENMLQSIFEGFDAGFQIAERRVVEVKIRLVDDLSRSPSPGVSEAEEQWDFMVDAMDWEAV